MTPWAWVGKALSTVLVLMTAGWAIGGGLGVIHPMIGLPVGAIATALVGAAWAATRIGGAGLGAALIGLIASVGAAIEGHHWWVAQRAAIVPVTSLTTWNPDSDVVAMQVSTVVVHERTSAATTSTRVRSGKGTRSVSQTATPLSEHGVVTAFFCGDERGIDGTFALSVARWHGTAPELCDSAIAKSIEKLEAAGRHVDRGAKTRVVHVFDSEASLRGAHRLSLVFVMPLVMATFYAVLVVLFRARGAASVQP